jgi:hypothetical protein
MLDLHRSGLDAHQQGPLSTRIRNTLHFTHRIAIELGQLWSLRADNDGAALPVLHDPVTTATAGQHPHARRQPSQDGPRPDGPDGYDIQQPVIHPGRGHPHQPGDKFAAVADHDRADPDVGAQSGRPQRG